MPQRQVILIYLDARVQDTRVNSLASYNGVVPPPMAKITIANLIIPNNLSSPVKSGVVENKHTPKTLK